MRNPLAFALLASAVADALVPEEDTKCPLCGGFGCVDDDPEVPGSRVECNNCHGKGFIPGRSKSGGA